METLAIHKVEAYRGELPDMPIQPDWVLEGRPQARGAVFWQCNVALGVVAQALASAPLRHAQALVAPQPLDLLGA